MFRKLVIAVITAWAAILETAADAIAETLPPPPRTVPGCGWPRPGGNACGCSSCHRLRVSPAHARETGRALAYLRAGDIFVITRLSRAIRITPPERSGRRVTCRVKDEAPPAWRREAPGHGHGPGPVRGPGRSP